MTLNSEYDEELSRYTISVEELSVAYGEGNTPEEAKDDLIETLVEYCLFLKG